MNTNTQSSEVEQLQQRVLEEMNARRTDNKTYIDSEWLLNKLITTIIDQHKIDLDNEYARGCNDGAYEQRVLIEANDETK